MSKSRIIDMFNQEDYFRKKKKCKNILSYVSLRSNNLKEKKVVNQENSFYDKESCEKSFRVKSF